MVLGLKVESFIGGLPIEDDKKNVKGCHIAIGAPGRIRHLMESHFLKTEHIKLFVLDEADKLVEQNFQTDINQIFHKLPVKKQVIASSATYPEHLDTFLSRYMHCPSYVSADADGSLLLGLKQFVSVVNYNANVVQQLKVKNERLNEILSKTSFTQCLVFTNYQTRAESASNILNQKGWNSSFISAAQEQKKRLEVVGNLKKCSCRILLSTDLTARGIDAANVDLVINYDVPYDAATYLHRMGRAGRYGSKGVCITLCCDGKELNEFKHILAVIAGPEVAVAKLNQIPPDLLNCDYNALDMIYGEINDAKKAREASKTVKDSLMNLKSQNNRKLKVDDTENKLEPETAQKPKQDINEKNQKVELNSLDKNNEKVRKSTQNKQTSETTKRDKLLLKNTMVYNITKHWSSRHEQNDESNQQLLSSIKNYLQDIENDDKIKIKKTKQTILNVATEEVLKNIDLYCRENDEEIVEEPLNNSTALETLFQSAYAHACGQSDKHWTLFFSDDCNTDFDAYCNSSPESDNEDDEAEFEDDEEMETSESEGEYFVKFRESASPIVPEAGTSSAAQEKPKTQNTELLFENNPPEEQITEFTEQFSSYFEECRKTLEETALTFEDLASFDEWYFYNWQTQVGHVREFVRQNIYVHEMRQFQDKRLNKNKEQ